VLNLHSSSLNFMSFLSAHFSSPLMSLWMGTQPSRVSATPPSFVSSANLPRVHFAQSCRSLMKMLNRIRPSIYPWGTLLATDLQIEFAPLITTLRPPYGKFSVHFTLCSSSPYINIFSMRILWDTVKDLTEVHIGNIHSSPIVYKASHFNEEVHQVGQA